MPLIQIQEGLLEQDNFYLTSSFSDFLGNGIYKKSINAFELVQGEIKRNFTYKDFVIEVTKTPKQLNTSEKHTFFVEVINQETKELRKIGIVEQKNCSDAAYWRITCHDGFIQSYLSEDGVSWRNDGGYKLINQEILYQGFEVKGDTSLIFTDYKVYSSSFVMLQNFDEGYKVELYDDKNTLLKTRLFDEDMKALIFLDYNIKGYFKIYDERDHLIFTSELLEIKMGDLYSYTPYELEMIYRGEVIGYGPTHLQKTLQLLQLKNVGSEDYERLRVIPFNATNQKDIIELSLDGVIYESFVTIPILVQNQVQDIYVRITKENIYDFVVNSFELKIY